MIEQKKGTFYFSFFKQHPGRRENSRPRFLLTFTGQGVAPGVPGRNVSQDLAFRLVLDRESLAIGLIRGHLPKVHCVSPK